VIIFDASTAILVELEHFTGWLTLLPQALVIESARIIVMLVWLNHRIALLRFTVVALHDASQEIVFGWAVLHSCIENAVIILNRHLSEAITLHFKCCR